MISPTVPIGGTETRLAIELSRDSKTNKPVAAYIRVCDGKVADTRELVEGIVFADYDDAERLLGIELLAPCKRELLSDVPAYESSLLREFIDSQLWPIESTP